MQYTHMLKHGVITPWSRQKEFLIQHSSFNSRKPAVKLDLGEMCKLVFILSQPWILDCIYSLIQTRSLAKYVFHFHLLCIRFLLLSTVNTLSIPYKFITKWKHVQHFLLECPLYNTLRHDFIEKVESHCSNFSSLDNSSKYIWLLTYENLTVLKEFCSYISKCLEIRRLSPLLG